jgi:hypothetical protein
VDAAVLQIKNKSAIDTWAAWLISGLLVLAVGFLNKSFSHPVINAFLFSPEWKDFIQEYQPATMYKGVKAIYALIIVVSTTLIFAAWKRRFGYFIVTMILAYFAVEMVRLVTPCGIIILCIFVSLASEFDLQKYIADSGKFVRSITGFAVLLLALTSFYSSVMNPRFFMKENKTSALIRPEVIVHYMKDNQLSGRIFNEFGIGGYLIHALSPDSKVYIDGRTNMLYPIDHYRRFLEARNSPIEFREEIERYDINLALLKTDQRAYSVMFESGLMGLDYVDYGFSFFTRDNPGLPFTGRLLGNPVCWREEHNSNLQAEYGYALLNLPANSSALPNLGMMLSYFLATDREGFLRDFDSSPSPTELQLRFAGYQSLSLGLYEESVNFFEAIEVWDQREFLAVALAYSRLGLWEKAEETIDHLTMVLWPHVTAQDMLLLYRILETIRREQGLQRVEGSYLDELRGQLEDSGRSTAELDLDPSLLCTEPPISDPVAS